MIFPAFQTSNLWSKNVPTVCWNPAPYLGGLRHFHFIPWLTEFQKVTEAWHLTVTVAPTGDKVHPPDVQLPGSFRSTEGETGRRWTTGIGLGEIWSKRGARARGDSNILLVSGLQGLMMIHSA